MTRLLLCALLGATFLSSTAQAKSCRELIGKYKCDIPNAGAPFMEIKEVTGKLVVDRGAGYYITVDGQTTIEHVTDLMGAQVYKTASCTSDGNIVAEVNSIIQEEGNVLYIPGETFVISGIGNKISYQSHLRDYFLPFFPTEVTPEGKPNYDHVITEKGAAKDLSKTNNLSLDSESYDCTKL